MPGCKKCEKCQCKKNKIIDSIMIQTVPKEYWENYEEVKKFAKPFIKKNEHEQFLKRLKNVKNN
jgi:hypothetical protein